MEGSKKVFFDTLTASKLTASPCTQGYEIEAYSTHNFFCILSIQNQCLGNLESEK